MNSELEIYSERLRQFRKSVLETLDDLNAEGLDWKPLSKDTNSLFVLGTHLAGSEHGWIAETLAEWPKTRDRAAEFQARGKNRAGLRSKYSETARETEKILAGLKDADLETTRPHEKYGTVTVRWILLHVIEHYSEHLGAMWLTRQLWENRSEELAS